MSPPARLRSDRSLGILRGIGARTVSIPLREDGLDALMAIASARLAIEDCKLDGPLNLAEPGHAGVLQEIEATAAVVVST